MEPPAPPDLGLSPSDRRWLHDKYEKLAEHEAQLADYRTSYFAVLNTALVAGTVLVVVNLLKTPPIFATAASLLAVFGLLMSAVWAIQLHRTLAAQNLWRDAALALETDHPPVPAPLTARIPGGVPDRPITVDLARPYHAHHTRFSREHGATFLDSIRPAELWSYIPVMFCAVWGTVIVVVWVWFWLEGGL